MHPTARGGPPRQQFCSEGFRGLRSRTSEAHTTTAKRLMDKIGSNLSDRMMDERTSFPVNAMVGLPSREVLTPATKVRR